MPEFSFEFSYDPHRRVAWLTLHGDLDQAGVQRLHGVLHTAVSGLAPQEVLVDVRGMARLDRASVRRLIRAGTAAERYDCDIVLVNRGLTRALRPPARLSNPAVA